MTIQPTPEEPEGESELERTANIRKILGDDMEFRVLALTSQHYNVSVRNHLPPIMSYYRRHELVELMEMALAKYNRDLYDYRHDRMRGD